MDSIVDEVLDRYEIAIAEKLALKSEVSDLKFKISALTRQIEELSRTTTVLRNSNQCLYDFIDSMEMSEDFEKFKDNWIGEKKL